MRGSGQKLRSLLICGGIVLLAGAPAGMGVGWAAQQAGVAAGVVGTLRVSEGERPAPEAVESGMDMLLGDRVNSAAASRMQVLLLDETVFTIGPDSDLRIDEFVYDPAAGTGRLTANFTKGVLRYISGKISHVTPAAITIKSREATIGVRGTALFIMDDPEATDGTQFIGLLGPGAGNDDALDPGRITISSGGAMVTVMRPGYGVFVAPGRALTKPVPTPRRLLQSMQGKLTGLTPKMRAQKAQKQAVARTGVKQKQQAVQNRIKQKTQASRIMADRLSLSDNRHANEALFAAIGGHAGDRTLAYKLQVARNSDMDRRSSLGTGKQITKVAQRAAQQRAVEMRRQREPRRVR